MLCSIVRCITYCGPERCYPGVGVHFLFAIVVWLLVVFAIGIGMFFLIACAPHLSFLVVFFSFIMV